MKLNLNLLKYIFGDGGTNTVDMNDPDIAAYEQRKQERDRQWYSNQIKICQRHLDAGEVLPEDVQAVKAQIADYQAELNK